ncbi:hypothetical protein E1B28_005459 [Marasmius oreades]|uniref:Domain of unknown function at the cortex 1 domain-containing protein n=1 Tax=Marasmius oreades TaxID=181124 RepID=A0A9P7S3L2_9AGAR|nr:uncharacterized protein E1B28_005459 [Marasmius oreades]KAG7094635.1 hypothetical protein E1B28_005459 [Marasmius oreades]
MRVRGEHISVHLTIDGMDSVMFGSKDIILIDFCYGFLEFSLTISLRLPGRLSFDVMRYWDGQLVRFVCCERKRPGDEGTEPWGTILCISRESRGRWIWRS